MLTPTKFGRFIRAFDHDADAFIARGIGAEMTGDIVGSSDINYVMRRIRTDYLGDSSITLVMIGNCTWSRRYVDWELQASLRSGAYTTPNGVLGIKLWSYLIGTFPNRLNLNVLPPDRAAVAESYARVYDMPTSVARLQSYFEDTHSARTSHARLIVNRRDRIWCNCKLWPLLPLMTA